MDGRRLLAWLHAVLGVAVAALAAIVAAMLFAGSASFASSTLPAQPPHP